MAEVITNAGNGIKPSTSLLDMLHNEEKVKTKIENTAADLIISTSASPLQHASARESHLHLSNEVQEPPMTMASTAAQQKQKIKSEKIPATVIDVADLRITDFGWNEDNIKLDFITGRMTFF